MENNQDFEKDQEEFTQQELEQEEQEEQEEQARRAGVDYTP